MTDTTRPTDEYAAFADYDAFLIKESQKKDTTSPRCHFRPMYRDETDCQKWWECSVCGHTKARYM